jgi:hypothetical protein
MAVDATAMALPGLPGHATSACIAGVIQTQQLSSALCQGTLRLLLAVPLPSRADSPEVQAPAAEQAETMLKGNASYAVQREPFEKRLLHLFHDAQGAHVWVRDAELGAAQAHALAQALAGELENTGNRLAALTVNGRKVALPAVDGELESYPWAVDQWEAAGCTATVSDITSKGQT